MTTVRIIAVPCRGLGGKVCGKLMCYLEFVPLVGENELEPCLRNLDFGTVFFFFLEISNIHPPCHFMGVPCNFMNTTKLILSFEILFEKHVVNNKIVLLTSVPLLC